MADKPTRPETPQDAAADTSRDARSRMRAAPTIDLTAEEVDAAPADRESARAGRAAPAGAAASADGKTPSRSGPDLIVTTLVAGFVGAVITAGGLAALWFSGYVPARDAASAGMQGRIAALQTQLDALPKQQAAPDTNAIKAIDALSERLGKLELAVAKLPARDPEIGERLTAADSAIKSLGIALTALNKRNDDVTANAAKAQQAADAAVKAVADLQASIQTAAESSNGGLSAAVLEPLQKRIAALEQSAQTARSEIVQNTTIDKAARLALAAAALRDAVVGGAPFAAELKVAQSLGADAKAIAALAPFAPHGVPSDKVLAHDLSALLPAMVKTAGAQKTPSGFPRSPASQRRKTGACAPDRRAGRRRYLGRARAHRARRGQRRYRRRARRSRQVAGQGPRGRHHLDCAGQGARTRRSTPRGKSRPMPRARIGQP